MKTTRQHINEVALGVATLLGIFTGRSDEQIDYLVFNYEAEGLNEDVQELLENAKQRLA